MSAGASRATRAWLTGAAIISPAVMTTAATTNSGLLFKPELLTKTLFEQPPKPSEFATVSPEMEAVLLQCLEKDTEKRAQDAMQVKEQLDAFIAKFVALYDVKNPGAENTPGVWNRYS